MLSKDRITNSDTRISSVRSLHFDNRTQRESSPQKGWALLRRSILPKSELSDNTRLGAESQRKNSTEGQFLGCIFNQSLEYSEDWAESPVSKYTFNTSVLNSILPQEQSETLIPMWKSNFLADQQAASRPQDFAVHVPLSNDTACIADKAFLSSLQGSYGGFLNTGMVRIWSAELILGYWCLKNAPLFQEKRVLEIGGGRSAFAGFCLAWLPLSRLTLTDGSPDCVSLIEQIWRCNKALIQGVKYPCCWNALGPVPECRQLLWGASGTELRGQFDVIIAADVLYECSQHQALLQTLDECLSNQFAFAYLLAPKRGNSLSAFMKAAQEGGQFWVEVNDRYDEIVWEEHQNLLREGSSVIYNEDKEYPLLITLKRRCP